jgi:hypothetical protein
MLARRAPEFGHHFAPGITVLGAARVFRVGEHVVLVAAQADRFRERPRAVRIERHTRVRETLGKRRHRFDFGVARQHAAFQLEVVETVAGLGRLGETHDRLGRHRLLGAQAFPVVAAVRAACVRQIRLAAIADVKQIAEHLDFLTLLAFTDQRRDWHTQMLAKQV